MVRSIVPLPLTIQLLQWPPCIFHWLDPNYFIVPNCGVTLDEGHFDYWTNPAKYLLNDFVSSYKTHLIKLKILPLMYLFELQDLLFAIKSIKLPTTQFNIHARLYKFQFCQHKIRCQQQTDYSPPFEQYLQTFLFSSVANTL